MIKISFGKNRNMGSQNPLRFMLFIIAFVFIPILVNVYVQQFRSTHSAVRLHVPKISNVTQHREGSSLYLLLTGGELDCGSPYNFFCKFWFFLRCVIFANYAEIHIVNNSDLAFEKLLTTLRPNDKVIFSYRRATSRFKLPKKAEILLEKRKASNPDSVFSTMRIGVFHVANEYGRKNFPWYSDVDFVIRNYWIPNIPPHVLYTPLPPQYPFGCEPSTLFSNTTQSYVENFIIDTSSNNCSCGNISTRPASERPYLWSFSGSLRRNRRKLLKALNSSSSIVNKGVVKIAKRFGGDGNFGSSVPEKNPKSAHLKLIADSSFVFAPCGNVMETHRIYEAIIMGAIPVIENCEPNVAEFFPFRPLISGKNVSAMSDFVERYVEKDDEMDRMQSEMMQWWHTYIQELSNNVSITIESAIPQSERRAI